MTPAIIFFLVINLGNGVEAFQNFSDAFATRALCDKELSRQRQIFVDNGGEVTPELNQKVYCKAITVRSR